MHIAEPVLVAVAELLPPGRALDLACGSGRNAIWLANRGWSVTAVDIAPAVPSHVRIETKMADLERHEYTIAPESWDLIVICRYLQRDLFEPAKAGVVPGGVIVAVVLLDDGKGGRFRMKRGELAGYFKDWEILRLSEDGHAEIAARKRK